MSEQISNHSQLLFRAKSTLKATSEGLGAVIGVSRRTMSRRWVPSLVLDFNALKKLATAVLDADRGLAEEIAAAAGTDLVAWGLVSPEVQVEAPEPPPALPAHERSPVIPAALEPITPPPPQPRLVDSVVCAAADLLRVPPQTVRPVLHAAFGRAQELGLDLELLVSALAPQE